MQCDTARSLISARVDGEIPGSAGVDTEGALDAHIAGCADCRAFEANSFAFKRGTMRTARVPDPDLTTRVFAALEPDRSSSTEARNVRIALGVVAFVQGLIAIPSLVNGDAGLKAHQARHLGVFSLALAAGFLYTALRPRRVGALLPFAAVLSVGLIVTGIIDVAAGRTPIAGESAHLLEVVGLTLMWILTRLERPRPRRDAGAPVRSPDLGRGD